MRKSSKRLVSGMVAAVALVGLGIGVLSANANVAIVPAEDDAGLRDVGALASDTSPLASFGPSFDGAPTWTPVTYAGSGGECFDVNAEWSGSVLGSIGGCGFGEDVDTLLRLLSVDQAAVDAYALISSANLTTPFALVEGHVTSADEELAYGIVAGIVDCACLVTARWTDGEVGSAEVVNGLFVIQREPEPAAQLSVSSVVSIEVEEAPPE